MNDFPTSVWTTFLDLRKDPERVKDLVARRYRQPVYEFVRRQGLPHEDAEDVTQEVFSRICRQKFLDEAHPSKGKFRALILAVTRHVIASFRRHALALARDKRREVTLDDFEVPVEIPSDAEFDRLWVRNLMEQAMGELRDDPSIGALRLQLGGMSYGEIAAQMKRTEVDVTNLLHRGKKKLREGIERQIRDYVGDGDLKEEIGNLLRYL